MSTAVAGKGLEGIVAANSGICWIDGDAGVLSYRGIDIHELAVHSTFEETTYLLWNGILPNELALREFQSRLTLARALDERIIKMLRAFPTSATPMEVLRTAVSALSFYDADEKDCSHDANVRKSYNLTAQMAMIVAIYDRIRKGKEIVPPDRTVSHAANFLWMLNGVKPSETATRTLDLALVLHAEHELNASTFAARVIAATLADIHSAVTGTACRWPGAGAARRARTERLHLCRPRHRRHPGRHSLGRHWRTGRAQGTAARRCQRGCDAATLRHRQGRRRPHRVREGPAGRQAEDHGLRPPRLQNRRPPRHPPAQDERTAWQR